MTHADQARIFSSREYNASQMTALLRSLEILVTSRYHACVLSLAAQVPQVAVGHDTRLATIYQDLGLKDRWFIEPGSANRPAPEIFVRLRERIESLLENPVLQKDLLCRGYEEHLNRARQNRRLLADFVSSYFSTAMDNVAAAVNPDLDAEFRGGMAWA
jgi:polysaccharide pyruvyl transferase WcaK-like protein